MKQLLVILSVFIFYACNQQRVNIPPPPHGDSTFIVTKPDVPINTRASHMIMGTTDIYATSEAALAQAASNRPYYVTVNGTIASKDTLCNSTSTTDPINGKNGWIAVTDDNGKTFIAIQVGLDGIIK
jgi:hypothetical protein